MTELGERHFRILILCAAFCSLLQPLFGADEKDKVTTITITYVKAPLNVPSIVEKKLGLFEKEFGRDGIKVAFPEITSGAKQTEALAAGSLDFCNALGGASAILAAANGVDLKIIAKYSVAPKAFMLIAKNPSIKSVADLKGKKIAGPKGTILHQLLVTALLHESMTADDVQFLSMEIPTATAALAAGTLDAALTAGPPALQALKEGAHVVVTGEGLVQGTIVVAVRGDFLRKHEDLVRRFLDVQRTSLRFIKQHPDEARALTADETGLSPDDVRMMMPWYDFDGELKGSDVEDLKATQDFLVKNGMLDSTVDVDGIIARLK